MVLIAALPAPARAGGSEVRNGGDPRRYRVHESFLYVWNALEYSEYIGRPDAAISWLQGYGGGFRRALENAQVQWVDQQPSGAAACLTASIPQKIGTLFRWSYADCPRRTSENYYIDQILNALFSPYSNDKELSDRIDAVHRMADAARAKNGDVPHQAENSIPFPESDLANAGRMNGHLNDARAMALYALRNNYVSSYAFFEFNSDDIVKGVMSARGPDLIHEVGTASVLWDANSKSCAYTEERMGAPIHFALGQCHEIKSVRDLAWMLIHEAVHHLGIAEETIADAVATGYLFYGDWFTLF
jgi:hypothetical protein